MDFTKYFKKYENLVKTAEGVFSGVKSEYEDCVKCKIGCSDCCYALFDLTLIEALYLNHRYLEKYADGGNKGIIEKANKADRQTYKIKRKAYKDLKSGKSEEEIFSNIAEERVRCPLLDSDDQCDLYDFRPLTCRFYGIPTSIGGQGHTCGKSGFEKGKKYPTVNLDVIQNKLYQLSAEIVKDIQSRHVKMHELLVPVSMAILTEYDDKYLGIGEEEEPEDKRSESGK